MTELLEKINKMHNEVDSQLDRKLELIGECQESGKECPCENEECNTGIEDLSELNDIYDRAFKDVILKSTEDLKKEN